MAGPITHRPRRPEALTAPGHRSRPLTAAAEELNRGDQTLMQLVVQRRAESDPGVLAKPMAGHADPGARGPDRHTFIGIGPLLDGRFCRPSTISCSPAWISGRPWPASRVRALVLPLVRSWSSSAPRTLAPGLLALPPDAIGDCEQRSRVSGAVWGATRLSHSPLDGGTTSTGTAAPRGLPRSSARRLTGKTLFLWSFCRNLTINEGHD